MTLRETIAQFFKADIDYYVTVYDSVSTKDIFINEYPEDIQEHFMFRFVAHHPATIEEIDGKYVLISID